MWILSCIVTVPQLTNMIQFKEKKSERFRLWVWSTHLNFFHLPKEDKSATVGLLAYPILMTSDILLYKATHVPVGEDQRQHLELSRSLSSLHFPFPFPLSLPFSSQLISFLSSLPSLFSLQRLSRRIQSPRRNGLLPSPFFCPFQLSTCDEPYQCREENEQKWYFQMVVRVLNGFRWGDQTKDHESKDGSDRTFDGWSERASWGDEPCEIVLIIFRWMSNFNWSIEVRDEALFDRRNFPFHTLSQAPSLTFWSKSHLYPTDIPTEKITAEYSSKSIVQFKSDLADLLINHISPIRTDIHRLINQQDEVERILQIGTRKARERAAVTMRGVRESIGLLPLPSDL